MQFVKTPAAPSDELFLFDLYASTRQEEMSLVPWSDEQKNAFLTQQFQAQHNYYKSKYPTADFSILSVDGVQVGRLYTVEIDGVFKILDITVAPEKRNQGFGSYWLSEIIEKAKEQNISVQIYIETTNRSANLLSRFGFQPKDSDEVYQLWEFTLQIESDRQTEIEQEVNRAKV
ncbi:MAG TPA: GNAT family N-acetyltransferase [Pyrinomonadaceae bacterium]|nr:GNAT family N-acetyltransferase [Pyrinomonadaceae bacterium]